MMWNTLQKTFYAFEIIYFSLIGVVHLFVSPSKVHWCGPSKKELDDALTEASTDVGSE